MTHANVLDSLVTKQAELSGLIAKLAVEGRNASDEEKGRMEALKADIDGIEKSWKDEGRARFLANFQPATERKLVLKAGDSLADHWKGSYDADLERASISKYLRGYALGDWSNAPLEMKTMASSAAGAILPTPISSRVLDLARNKAVSFMAGAVTVPMGAATLKLPRLTGDVTAGWYSEGGTISESDATLDSVTLTARKVAVLVRVNNELLEDSSPAVDAILEESIAQAMALEIDRVALNGTGTAPEPRGIRNQSGIQTGAVSGALGYEDLVTGIYAVRNYNREPNAIINHVQTALLLSRLVTGLSGDTTPAVLPDDYARVPRFTTKQLPSNLGGGTNETVSIVGDFTKLIIGVRSNVSIEVSRDAEDAFKKDQTMIRATARIDVQLADPKAFYVMTGIVLS